LVFENYLGFVGFSGFFKNITKTLRNFEIFSYSEILGTLPITYGALYATEKQTSNIKYQEFYEIF
jgi:hypothetical protein